LESSNLVSYELKSLQLSRRVHPGELRQRRGQSNYRPRRAAIEVLPAAQAEARGVALVDAVLLTTARWVGFFDKLEVSRCGLSLQKPRQTFSAKSFCPLPPRDDTSPPVAAATP
jgi:hypothetical protein